MTQTTIVDEPAPERASILLVDDRPDKHVVYRSILEELGQNLVVAHSGEEALKEVLKTEFAVILLDVNMPGMDGLETAELIRGRKQSAHVPIIFVTADYGDEARTAKGYSLGAVDFMVSPIIPEVLRTKVKVFVDLFLFAQIAKRQAQERGQLAAERAARAAAELANERLAFLARASAALSGSLNLSATVRELARLTVPFLADFAALTVPGANESDERTELVWAGEAVGSPPHIESQASVECDWWREAIARVMASGIGESFLSPEAFLARHDKEGVRPIGYLEDPRGGKIESLVILPLSARGRIVGVLSLGLGTARGAFDANLLSIASDVAARAAIAMDNAMLYKEIRDQDHRKDEFLAMLSHELRNPLAPITNAVHMLATGDAQQVAWATEVLERQVKQLRRLVDDLLDISRITHGKIQLQLGSVDVGEMIAVAVEASKPLVDARGHTLTVKPLPQAMRVHGDFARLTQIVANLLNNAAKYTQEGGTISLHAAREGDQVAIRVVDSGVGIPKEALATIFEPFRQLGHAADRPAGGLGIGLTLVKQLVEKHGGAVEARSEGPDKGSEFVVRLPMHSGASTTIAPQEPATDARAAAPARRRRILVADDNVDLATSMGLLLELMGNEVRVTHDGLAAVSAEAEFRPDVVFLDIGMERMNGFDACRSIRGNPWGKEPIIVALTGWGQSDDKRRSQEAGFDHHLVKPIEPAMLQRFLAEIETQPA